LTYGKQVPVYIGPLIRKNRAYGLKRSDVYEELELTLLVGLVVFLFLFVLLEYLNLKGTSISPCGIILVSTVRVHVLEYCAGCLCPPEC